MMHVVLIVSIVRIIPPMNSIPRSLTRSLSCSLLNYIALMWMKKITFWICCWTSLGNVLKMDRWSMMVTYSHVSRDRADAVVAKLLENFITQKPPPALSSSAYTFHSSCLYILDADMSMYWKVLYTMPIATCFRHDQHQHLMSIQCPWMSEVCCYYCYWRHSWRPVKMIHRHPHHLTEQSLLIFGIIMVSCIVRDMFKDIHLSTASACNRYRRPRQKVSPHFFQGSLFFILQVSWFIITFWSIPCLIYVYKLARCWGTNASTICHVGGKWLIPSICTIKDWSRDNGKEG